MTSLVVDVSVAAKWYLPEDHTDKAEILFAKDIELHVPDLFFPELGNVLWKRWRRDEIDADTVADSLDALDTVPFVVHRSRELLASAVELAMTCQCSVYDATYLALAVGKNLQLVTADRRLRNAVKNSLGDDHILWIEELA